MGFLGMALLALLRLFPWLLFFFIVLGLFFVIGRSGVQVRAWCRRPSPKSSISKLFSSPI